MRKHIQLLWLILTTAVPLWAQQVPRLVVAEHFTNSYCSICASRNPGLYQNLSQYPQVLHLAYYPSAPYAACPINQYNKPEQDARTNYYGVYGSTPRLLLQGIAYGGNFSDPALFPAQLNATSSFEARISIKVLNATTGEARLSIIKRDTSTLDSLQLYAVLAQDTLNFAANNGEAHHYDVFRKAIWGTEAVKILLPVAVGDSLIYTKTFSVNQDWVSHHIYATALLQRPDKAMEQAARSQALVIPGNPTAVGSTPTKQACSAHPNPAHDQLYLSLPITGEASIYDLQGKRLEQQQVMPGGALNLSRLAAGYYLLQLATAEGTMHLPFIKE